MNKIITLTIVGFVGLATHSASAVESQIWNPWMKDMCAEGIRTDVQNCYKGLYCPRGTDRVNMNHHVTIRQAKFAENWKEVFTYCHADCSSA